MSLHDDLQDIQGIGPAKADAIADVIDEHDTDGDTELVAEALDYLRQNRRREARRRLEAFLA